jgi:LDH2 family malate/lactate/ureidoglycolate dehydrogenase
MENITKTGIAILILTSSFHLSASQAYVSVLAPGGSVSQFNVTSGTMSTTFAAPLQTTIPIIISAPAFGTALSPD